MCFKSFGDTVIDNYLENTRVSRMLNNYEKELQYYKGYNEGFKEGCNMCSKEETSETNFYRFPDMSAGKDWDLTNQFEKIEEELEEAKNAYFRNDGNEHAILEMMDVLHAVETWFRIEGLSPEELKAYSIIVHEKNAKRGYYDVPVENKDNK